MRQYRKRQRSIFYAAGLAALLFTGPAALQTAAGNTMTERKLAEALRDLLDGSKPAADIRAECLDALKLSEDAGDYRDVTAAFLDVPSDEALPALCTALIQGAADGDITEESLRPMLNPTGDDAEAQVVGHLLRAIYYSHQKAVAAGAPQ
jgi:hypothetical protein